METVNHPGYLRSSSFQLHVATLDMDNMRNLVLAINNFNLPELMTDGPRICWGPGYPIMAYGGPPSYSEISLDVTNYYDMHIVEFLVIWHEKARVNTTPFLRDGEIIGLDDACTPQYRCLARRMWPTRVSMGEMSRDTNKQHISCTFFVWEYVHIFDREVHP